MEDHKNTGLLLVGREEAGQKLLNFLRRRISAPLGDFHRWIRTGQVRINGCRAKAFDRISEGDAVRVPPFAKELSAESAGKHIPTPPKAMPPLNIVFEDEEILIIAKPAGLPVQGGTGHSESIASCLARERACAAFVPAPVHRLDKDTSGLLAAGKTYAAVRLLTDALAGRGGKAPHKEYLAWVEGCWPYEEERELSDYVAKDEKSKRMCAALEGCAEAKEARCMVTPLEQRRIHNREYTLVLVRLLTGRTHQIRLQLSLRGHPIAGDMRYGQSSPDGLKLHAFRLEIPLPNGSCRRFELPPPWKGAWKVTLLGGK